MSIDPGRWERKRLRISQITPHPSQDYFFGHTTSPAEDEAFRRDLAQDGQRDPIHVMPPRNKAGLATYTILDGRRRVAALEANGEEHVNAIIRHDLTDADEATVEAVFLQFNFQRRHLHPLDRARIALRQFQIERHRPRGELRLCEEREARDRVGKAIGMGGRNLGRYFRVLLTPLEIQQAVRDGRLPLVLGERVSWLPKDKQAEIAERIRDGEQAKAVVGAYVAPSNGRHQKAANAFSRFVASLKQALADLEDRPHEVYCGTLKEMTPLLKRGRQLIAKLITDGRKKPRSIAGLLNGDQDLCETET